MAENSEKRRAATRASLALRAARRRQRHQRSALSAPSLPYTHLYLHQYFHEIQSLNIRTFYEWKVPYE